MTTSAETTFPMLETERLCLRRFELSDANRLYELWSTYEIARNEVDMDYPFPRSIVNGWIDRVQRAAAHGRWYAFALTLKPDGGLIGCLNLVLEYDHTQPHVAEMGYWLGAEFVGHGYMTEAGLRVVRFAFEELGMQRLYGRCFARNTRSSSVLKRLGMKHEKTLHNWVLKWGVFEDVESYGLMRSDWTGA